MIKHKILVAFVTSMLTIPALAQDTTRHAIEGLGMYDDSRIVLRWAPSTPAAWSVLKRNGYVVDRWTVSPTGAYVEPEPVVMTPTPIIPWSDDRFLEGEANDRPFALVVREALYGDGFEPDVSTGFLRGLRNQTKELNYRFGFSLFAADLDSVAAEALGVRLVDTDIDPGVAYRYRIYPAVQDSLYPIDTASVYVDTNFERFGRPPSGFEANPGDGQVNLRWDKHTFGERFTAFWLERSTDGISFERMTEIPLTASDPTMDFALYADTALVNYRTYTYRLFGITPFATISPPAELKVTPRDQTPPPMPLITGAEHVRDAEVRLTWSIPDTLLEDLDGFYIGHGANADGPFELDLERLLPIDAREVVDGRARVVQMNYFVIAAVDTAQNFSQSFPALVQLRDSIPPAMPTGFQLASPVDTTGIIRIRWNRGSELDLFGYRLYRANHIDDEFMLHSKEVLRDTSFVDTLNVRSLTQEVYYRVQALDFNYNPSEMSEAFRVELPDIIPPVTPVFSSALPSDTSVTITWSRSPSRDVKLQRLYRRTSLEDHWTILMELPGHDTTFTDFAVEKLKVYEYTIQAVDSTNLHSNLALPVKGRVFDTGERAGVSRLLAEADTTAGVIRLSWEYPDADSGEYWFVVYRGSGDAVPARYRSAGTDLTFVDRRARYREEDRYVYAVEVRYRNGGRSPLSEHVAVQYPRAEVTRNDPR